MVDEISAALIRYIPGYTICQTLHTKLNTSPLLFIPKCAMTSVRALLQLPFDKFYTNTNAIDSFFPVSLVLIGVEAILLGFTIIQLVRFLSMPNIYLKKIIHVLIGLQLIGMFFKYSINSYICSTL